MEETVSIQNFDYDDHPAPDESSRLRSQNIGRPPVIIEVPPPIVLDDKHFSMYPSLSDVNDFIPVRALRQGDLYTSEKGNKLLFYTFDFRDYGYTVKKFSSFANNLFFSHFDEFGYEHTNSPSDFYRLSHLTVLGKYYSAPGILFSYNPVDKIATPLILLTIRSSQLYNIRPDNIRPEFFTLLIDRELINNEDAYKIYRNIKKYYIDKAEAQIDIMYTDDIKRLCFNSGLEVPKFKTYSDRVKYANEINDQVFRMLSEE